MRIVTLLTLSYSKQVTFKRLLDVADFFRKREGGIMQAQAVASTAAEAGDRHTESIGDIIDKRERGVMEAQAVASTAAEAGDRHKVSIGNIGKRK
jgi:hypothetical protein